ncbi:MAG: VIT domain-containing protein [Planctomycetota bacterium]
MTFRTLVLGALAAAILALSASAQQRHTRGWAANVIVPQARGYRIDRAQGPVQVKAVDVQVTIVEQVASTTLTITLHNPTRRRQEAEVVLPVPKDVALSRFSYSGGAAEPALQLLVKEEAQKIYDGLVRKLRDPALLEFAGYGLIRFKKGEGTVTFECWPRSADVTQPGARQFPGWPRTITP